MPSTSLHDLLGLPAIVKRARGLQEQQRAHVSQLSKPNHEKYSNHRQSIITYMQHLHSKHMGLAFIEFFLLRLISKSWESC